jgi:conjugative relaxase-like TrwC/TraI family protein
MLRVTTIHANTAGASARYYTRYLAEDGPDSKGRWLGRQAEGLGLSGTVSTEDLEALLSGHDPTTGTRLGTPLVDRVTPTGKLIRAVAGFDATFSAPKSLSVWWGLTGDPGLLEAHDLAVRAVLEHLERYGATTRVRVNGNRQHPDTRGLTMAAFRQATSRDDDPQLHTHVVVSAKVQTAEGRWMALDARYLKRHQRALGGLYQSVLRTELSHRYGVAWGPIEDGQAEIAGARRELLDVFSKRTAQVDAALADKIDEFCDREGRDPSRWERAALTREAAGDTRATKTHASTADLSAQWRDEATALGWTPGRLVAAMRIAAQQAPVRELTVAVAEVLELLSATGSTWTRADVLKAVCDLAPPVSQRSGRDWARAVERASDRVIAGCTSLDPPDARAAVRASDGRSIWLPPSDPYVTHDRILAQEERILSFALDTHDRPAQPSTTLDRDGLDVFQANAAAAVAGNDRLVLVVGPAGTGKTTALRRAVADLNMQACPVFGVAPTAKAAKVLGDETGMEADTLAKLLHEWRSVRPLESSGCHRAPRSWSTKPACVERVRSTSSSGSPLPSTGGWRWSVTRASSRRSAPAACSASCAAPGAPTSSPPSTASTTGGKRRRPSSCDAATPPRSTPTSTTAASPPGASISSPPKQPASGSSSPPRVAASPSRRRPTSTSTRSTPQSNKHGSTGASSAIGWSRSPPARRPRSAMWWRPAATTGQSAPTGANRCATATSGPSPASAWTAASPSRTSTDTARSPCPSTTCERMSGWATPPPSMATRATPST